MVQGQIQDSLMGSSYLQRGFDLLILSANLLIFPDFLKLLRENDIILSQRVIRGNHLNPPGSATVVTYQF